ncbi:hypothetical protein [Burkholderia glumae]|uniref:hypothetical protein n=1 Tax=Burkholderia glumae TaxID=337 RepID=UPI0003022389|nr:hypothetical protein [Burkholderia glumae]MCM2492834.1 hypothetical protein [Burkholderia glumae]MCM2544478.1 hypothetical protein [Burkholderia glumae]
MLIREARTPAPMPASAAPFKGTMTIRQTIVRRTRRRRGVLLACTVLMLALGGCGVFCGGAGSKDWIGGACGTTVHF